MNCASFGTPSAMVALLILFSCSCSLANVTLQWSEVDLAQSMIVLPPARTKNKRKHEIPLSRQALAIIQRQPRIGTGQRSD
jgi:integrase